uniref:non-specific serine/threonine protein kinase n=1 Tax=Trypanosoma vivax (strain Y486) TaxID=1055687 RepID=G0TXP3_TRYVY|nr:putative protein kinase, fragment [Trypanosoma vivax Y486]
MPTEQMKSSVHIPTILWNAEQLEQLQTTVAPLGPLHCRSSAVFTQRDDFTPRRQSSALTARVARVASSGSMSPRYAIFTQRRYPISSLNLNFAQGAYRTQAVVDRGFSSISQYRSVVRSSAGESEARATQPHPTAQSRHVTAHRSSLPMEQISRQRFPKRQNITERKLRIVRQDDGSSTVDCCEVAATNAEKTPRTKTVSEEQLGSTQTSITVKVKEGQSFEGSSLSLPPNTNAANKKPVHRAAVSIGRSAPSEDMCSLHGSLSEEINLLSNSHGADANSMRSRDLSLSTNFAAIPRRASATNVAATPSPIMCSSVQSTIVQRRLQPDCTSRVTKSTAASAGAVTATTAGVTPTTSSNRSHSSLDTLTDINCPSQSTTACVESRNNLVSSRSVMQQFVQQWRNNYEENKKAYFEGGYMTVTPGKKLISRYGKPHQAFVAIKIAKCDNLVSESTQYEINLLQYIRDNTSSTAPITCLLNSFEVTGQYGTHICMVMPLHGSNLLSIIDQMKLKKVIRTSAEIRLIKEIVASTLIGLNELHKLDVIHTDIKPENILSSSSDPRVLETIEVFCLRNKDRSSMVSVDRVREAMWQGDPNHLVCIADFGLSVALKPSSEDADAQQNEVECGKAKHPILSKKEFPVEKAGTVSNLRGTMIQTREYRAPEIIIGLDFNTRSDIWSVGCVVYELITGEFLMDPKRRTRNERTMDVEHLAMIMQILGPVPDEIVKQRDGRGPNKPPPRFIHRYFDENYRFIYADKYRLYPRRHIDKELQTFLPPPEAKAAASFILACLSSYDPVHRPSAQEMLDHPWLQEVIRK